MIVMLAGFAFYVVGALATHSVDRMNKDTDSLFLVIQYRNNGLIVAMPLGSWL